MNIQRAQELTKAYKMTLVQGPDYALELYFLDEYIGELYPAQIAEMNEDDFIEFYLDAGISPSEQKEQLDDFIEYREYTSDIIHDKGYSSMTLHGIDR